MSSNGPTFDNKSDLLFKQFTGVVNERQDLPFTGQNYPFRNFVMNKEIFTYDIPKDLSNVTFIDGQDIYYGRQALDFSFNHNQISMDSSYIIPDTNLKFYYKLELQKANTGTNRTWYYDDGTGEKNSLLRDTIPFKFDASYTSYTQSLYINSGNNSVGMNASPIYWLLDYKSGFVQFYGEETAVNNWVANNGPPRFSFIKYVGDKGAGGGSNSAVLGGDASFSNVDISQNLTVENLTVNNSANLPENTLIQPIWHSLVGSNNSSNPFFNKGYPEVKQYAAYLIDTSINPISSNDWITIARTGEDNSGNADGRADALFKLSYPNSGRHETITFIASFKYSKGLGINVLHHDWYSGPDFSGLRIAYNSTYHGAVLQLQFNNNLNTTEKALTINIMNNEDYPGWNQYTDVSGTKVKDGIDISIAIPDNNPQSLNTFGGNTVPLTNQFLLSNLSWNPSNTNTNQITTNPSKFIKEVDILEDTHIYKNLHVDKSISQRDCVTGTNSVAFGVSTDASGESSFSHGNQTVSSGPGSHAEGLQTTSRALFSHAEGQYSECISGATFSHAEGYNCKTYGVSSHAEGENCEAHGQSSHASGRGTIIGNNSNGGTSMGTYNDTSQNVLLVVGDGTSDANRSDAMTILTGGNARFYNDLTVDGNLIIQDNNYLQIFKSEPFDQNFGNIPLAQIFIPFTGIPGQSIDSIAHANFEIIVKNNGLQTYSELHHIISGNISISIIYDNNTTILDDNIMINILHSSYSGDTPLIKRIFIEKNGKL